MSFRKSRHAIEEASYQYAALCLNHRIRSFCVDRIRRIRDREVG